MKTLFLLGIFAALTVIAIKKPDQTAWDFVQEVVAIGNNNLGDIAPGRPADGIPALKETSDTWGNVERTVATLRSRAKDLESAASKIATPDSEDASPGQNSEEAKPETVITPDAPPKTEPASPPKPSKEEVSKLPEIPILPDNPMKPSTVGNLLTPPRSEAIARRKSGKDYDDVKALYENASRLLDQIK